MFGLIDHYMSRPGHLDNICLAEFDVWYEFQTNTRARIGNKNLRDLSSDDEGAGYSNKSMPLVDGSGYVCRSIMTKAICCFQYDIHQDEMNYYLDDV